MPPGFFLSAFNGCGRWLVDHPYFKEKYFPAHLANQDLPAWVPLLIQDVDFSGVVGRVAIVTVCAELLDISPQQVYAQLP